MLYTKASQKFYIETLFTHSMLSKSLIQFSVDGRSVFPSGCLVWEQTVVGVMAVMTTSFKRAYIYTVVFSVPDPAAIHCRPIPQLETPGHSQANLAQSLVGHTAPFSWVLVCTRFCLGPPLQSLFPQSCGSSIIKSLWPPKSNSLEILHPCTGYPGWEICCGS